MGSCGGCRIDGFSVQRAQSDMELREGGLLWGVSNRRFFWSSVANRDPKMGGTRVPVGVSVSNRRFIGPACLIQHRGYENSVRAMRGCRERVDGVIELYIDDGSKTFI